jgi:hypothetical protein
MIRATLSLSFLVQLATAPAGLLAQAPPEPAGYSYRGFRTGQPYREFAQRARALQVAVRQPLICSTARRTAQVMECAVRIRDSVDGVVLQLAAHFIDGRAGFVSFGDSGDAALVERMQREARALFGPPSAMARGTWEWRAGRQFTRLNWRGRGAARWVYLTLTDLDVLERIAPYVTPTPPR